jgi:hypothetical protein
MSVHTPRVLVVCRPQARPSSTAERTPTHPPDSPTRAVPRQHRRTSRPHLSRSPVSNNKKDQFERPLTSFVASLVLARCHTVLSHPLGTVTEKLQPPYVFVEEGWMPCVSLAFSRLELGCLPCARCPVRGGVAMLVGSTRCESEVCM